MTIVINVLIVAINIIITATNPEHHHFEVWEEFLISSRSYGETHLNNEFRVNSNFVHQNRAHRRCILSVNRIYKMAL